MDEIPDERPAAIEWYRKHRTVVLRGWDDLLPSICLSTLEEGVSAHSYQRNRFGNSIFSRHVLLPVSGEPNWTPAEREVIAVGGVLGDGLEPFVGRELTLQNCTLNEMRRGDFIRTHRDRGQTIVAVTRIGSLDGTGGAYYVTPFEKEYYYLRSPAVLDVVLTEGKLPHGVTKVTSGIRHTWAFGFGLRS